MDHLSNIFQAAWALRFHIGVVVILVALGLNQVRLLRKLAAARDRIRALEAGIGLVGHHMRARLEAYRSGAR